MDPTGLSQSPFKPLDPGSLPQSPPKDFLKMDSRTPTGASVADGKAQGVGAQNSENLDDAAELGNDAEGVWAPDIEQAFQEALAIYPPCGRRKIILSDEGKMYGRNELIARYIKLRTGKSRTRKQVSSHIQVLARKKSREIQGKIKDQAAKEKAMAGLSSMSSAQIVSASVLQNAPSARMFGTPGIAGNAVPMHTMLNSPGGQGANPVLVKHELLNPATAGLIWHPSLAQTAQGQQAFIPNSMMGGAAISQQGGPQLQVAGAPGPFIAAVQTPDHATSMAQSPEDAARVGVPFVIANPAAMEHAGPNIPPPNLPLKMVEFVAFVDKSKSESDSDQKHEFVNIGPSSSFADPNMEAVDIRHIADKFPEKNGGLKDLFDKGPQDRFFLVKFWYELEGKLQPSFPLEYYSEVMLASIRADINTSLLDDVNAFYGVTSQYESSDNMTISCSTKVCSFGKQVVEKVETEYARFDNGRFVYRINRSPMCDYMVSFIHRLKHLPEKYMMNSVLENFTILQVVTNRETQETLLCMAYVFEVCTSDDGPKHRIYRLIKEN